MTVFDAGTKRRITRQWSSLFPYLTAWKPMRLVRRVGPVVQGITLERSTSGPQYFATSHLHALTRPFPVVSLSLSHRVLGASGQPERIPVDETDLTEVAERLVEQTSHSLAETAPTVAELVGVYHAAAAELQRTGGPPAVLEVEDSILVASVIGDDDLVGVGLSLAEELAGLWPSARLPPDWTTAADWLAGLAAQAGKPSALAETVADEIRNHRLEKVRVV